ncbi:hypothetical protein FRB94_005990 [Tulasnella sp. JGI-2019a]|nr:hypothetical protein FRB94_005990 [Tulasnella sp. JGI-2019a]
MTGPSAQACYIDYGHRRFMNVKAILVNFSTSSGGGPTTVGFGLSLSFTGPRQLTCLTSAVNVLATYGASLTSAAKAEVLASVAAITAFTSQETTTLDAALVALKASGASLLSSTYVDICAKAQISLSVTVSEIDCLRAFISTTLAVNYGIAVAEVAVYNWCNNLIGYTSTQLKSLAAQIAALGTTTVTTVSASLSEVIALRAKLLAYVNSLIASADLVTKAKLAAIIAEINLWVIGSVVTSTDYDVCSNIMKHISSCGYSGILGWDLSVFGSLGAGAHV